VRSIATIALAGAVGLLAATHAPQASFAQSPDLFRGWTDYGLDKQSSRGEPSGGASLFGYGQAEPFPRIMDGGGRPWIEPRAPDIVWFQNNEAPGTILIDTAARRLYFTLDAETAYIYRISVGREGFTWTGTERISAITEWPDWHPPKEMLERDPRLPELMYGGIKNPLGAVALFLGNSLYRIHGTNDPKTIGLAASSGCFRMLNEHAVHLASIAKVGTVVKVLPSLEDPAVAELPWLQKPAALGVSHRRYE
jgi:lipoprotein-anchoring transpeptidase ErfK/SrfK